MRAKREREREREREKGKLRNVTKLSNLSIIPCG